MSESEKLADMVFQSVRVYVDRKFATALEAATTQIREQMAIIEKTLAELPPREQPTIDDARIEAAVEKAVSAIEIVVPPGEPGPAGKDGAAGKDAVVDYGAIKETIAEIVKGQAETIAKEFSDMIAETVPSTIKAAVDAIPKPKDGEPGRDGRDAEGRPGRDAAEIAPLPMIHEERSYPQGTWARHLGGLWRAERDTDPIEKGAAAAAGWAVVVEGPARLQDIALDLKDDGRTLVLGFESSAGRIERSLTVPWPIDRGVWKPDRDYEKGDGATFNGSYWIAQAVTKDRPGTSAAWRLAVKAGRDGKDMRPNGTIERVPVRLAD